MDVKVLSIDVDRADSTKMGARVTFYQEDGDGFGYHANLDIWIPKRDARLSELREDVVRAAVEFLNGALAAAHRR